MGLARGYTALQRGDNDAAIGRLDEAVRLEPKQANCGASAAWPGSARETMPKEPPI